MLFFIAIISFHNKVQEMLLVCFSIFLWYCGVGKGINNVTELLFPAGLLSTFLLYTIVVGKVTTYWGKSGQRGYTANWLF